MPCIDAIDRKALSVSADLTVEQALALLKKSKASVALVLGEDGQPAGLFSIRGLMQGLMPVSLPVGDGPIPAIRLDAAPGVAKRLRRLYPLPVGQVMERRFQTVEPGARLIEAIQKILETGAPGVLVGNEDEGFAGLITEQSVMDRLEGVGNE